MLGKAFGRSKKQKDTVPRKGAGSVAGQPSIGRISKMISASGRIGLPTLKHICEVYNREDFTKFMQQPALVGSAIHSGTLSAQVVVNNQGLNSTVLFEPAIVEEDSGPPSDSLQHAIYPLIKSDYATTARNTFFLGRIDGNDMIMPDYAISKQHAILEIKRGSYYIRDCGSTNGTMVNGTRLEKKPAKINDKDIIGFARYEFTFFFPEALYVMLRGDIK